MPESIPKVIAGGRGEMADVSERARPTREATLRRLIVPDVVAAIDAVDVREPFVATDQAVITVADATAFWIAGQFRHRGRASWCSDAQLTTGRAVDSVTYGLLVSW